jgi:hypothetical protein
MYLYVLLFLTAALFFPTLVSGQYQMTSCRDPAVVGADKVLRISARDMQGQVRQFSYKGGSSIDASQCYNYGGGGYPQSPGYPGNPGYPPGCPGGGQGDLQIIRAFYGLNHRDQRRNSTNAHDGAKRNARRTGQQ